MKELLEQGLGEALIGVVTGIGILTRVILFGYYGRLSKACKNFGQTNNKTICYIREDLKQRASRDRKLKSAMVYTECRLAECKTVGIRVGVLECMLQQSLLLAISSGVMIAFAGVLAECDSTFVFSILFMSGMTAFLFLVVDLCLGMREKNKRIRLSIRDYIENTWEAEACPEEVSEPERKKKRELRKEKRLERMTEKKSVKRDKSAKNQTRKQSKKHGKAQEEKRRLTEELLRERRQLEARSFAEQRRKEKEEVREEMEEVTEESMVEQVQAEAAVTECADVTETKSREFSYEALLSEVLAEYLA